MSAKDKPSKKSPKVVVEGAPAPGPKKGAVIKNIMPSLPAKKKSK